MTHYQALELPETATAEDIRRAYRRLVLLTHPDRTPDSAAHARYLVVNAAYETLSNPSLRRVYDAALSRPAPTTAPSAPAGRVRGPYYRSGRGRGPRNATTQGAGAYQGLYFHYAKTGRLVCKILLVFGLLLAIDRVWILKFPREKVLNCTLYETGKGKSFCVSETPNANFRSCLNEGETLWLRRTALFNQVLSYGYTSKEGRPDAEEYQLESIHANTGSLLALTMFVTAAVGAWPGRIGRRQVDCATTAAILAVILVWLLRVY